MEISTKDKIRYYVETFTGTRIDTAELSREFNVTRQRVWSILESIGETRHQRKSKEEKLCEICKVRISRNAQFCRVHAKKINPRVSGQFYICRICNQSKVLEQFARNAQYSSGYDTRCLTCRAEWQRDYHLTERGKQQHSVASKTLNTKHPERQRAYYQVNQALKNGTITKLPCSRCQSLNSRAIQTDYNRPLEVIWLCSLCKHRNPMFIKPYESDAFEEQFRAFINTTTGDTRWSSKWIKILKAHYQLYNITEDVLHHSLQSKDEIKGFGTSYKELIAQFLQSLKNESSS